MGNKSPESLVRGAGSSEEIRYLALDDGRIACLKPRVLWAFRFLNPPDEFVKNKHASQPQEKLPYAMHSREGGVQQPEEYKHQNKKYEQGADKDKEL
jgi:hypothetical protein